MAMQPKYCANTNVQLRIGFDFFIFGFLLFNVIGSFIGPTPADFLTTIACIFSSLKLRIGERAPFITLLFISTIQT